MTERLDGLLAEVAATHPRRRALIVSRPLLGTRKISFRRLNGRVDAAVGGLRAVGLEPGQRAAVLIPPTLDFFVVIFALLRLGAVPVLIDPGIGRRHLRTCLGEAAPDAFIGVPKAHLARRILRWCPQARLAIVVGPGRLRWCDIERLGATLRRTVTAVTAGPSPQPAPAGEMAADDVAAIVFTSGSTGVPKGVLQTHKTLLAQIRLIASLYDLGPDQVSLATFPPFALFGPPLGMTTVVPRMDPTRPARARPRRVMSAANRNRATVLFGSPALLDTLTRGRAGARMPTLTRVISAGAPVSRALQRAVLEMCPHAEVFSPYGATEALPVTSIGSTELLGLPEDGICVGRPAPGVDVTLIPVTDEPCKTLTTTVAPGTVGEIVVRGPNVTTSYLDRPESDAAAKIGWGSGLGHRMGDLAHFDTAGRLWFAGRKSHRVETDAGTMFSVPCESVFDRHPAVRRSALVGLGRPERQVPVVCVETEPGVAPSARLTAELLALGASDVRTAGIETVLYHPGFPVDVRHNSKIDRPELARWAQRRRTRRRAEIR